MSVRDGFASHGEDVLSQRHAEHEHDHASENGYGDSANARRHLNKGRHRPRRSAAARRAQQLRANTRCVLKLTLGLIELNSHRGNKLTALGQTLFECIGGDFVPDGTTSRQQCRRYHEARRTMVCRHWAVGRCSYGASCRFAHPSHDNQYDSHDSDEEGSETAANQSRQDYSTHDNFDNEYSSYDHYDEHDCNHFSHYEGENSHDSLDEQVSQACANAKRNRSHDHDHNDSDDYAQHYDSHCKNYQAQDKCDAQHYDADAAAQNSYDLYDDTRNYDDEYHYATHRDADNDVHDSCKDAHIHDDVDDIIDILLHIDDDTGKQDAISKLPACLYLEVVQRLAQHPAQDDQHNDNFDAQNNDVDAEQPTHDDTNYTHAERQQAMTQRLHPLRCDDYKRPQVDVSQLCDVPTMRSEDSITLGKDGNYDREHGFQDASSNAADYSDNDDALPCLWYPDTSFIDNSPCSLSQAIGGNRGTYLEVGRGIDENPNYNAHGNGVYDCWHAADKSLDQKLQQQAIAALQLGNGNKKFAASILGSRAQIHLFCNKLHGVRSFSKVHGTHSHGQPFSDGHFCTSSRLEDFNDASRSGQGQGSRPDSLISAANANYVGRNSNLRQGVDSRRIAPSLMNLVRETLELLDPEQRVVAINSLPDCLPDDVRHMLEPEVLANEIDLSEISVSDDEHEG